MTSQRTQDGYAFECDGKCGEVWEPPRLGLGSAPRTFPESLEDAKEDGWVARKGKKSGEWQHFCKDCK